MRAFSLTPLRPCLSAAALLWVAATSLGCEPGGHGLGGDAGVAGSALLAIDDDYLFALNQERVLRYDRETGVIDALEAPGQVGDFNFVGLNATRVFYATEGGGLSSLPREGGAARVESESAPEGCFGQCAALDDATLYMSSGNEADGAELVVVDLATGSATTRDAPWAVSLAVDEETVFGMSCYALWSIPREGGEVTTRLQTEVWGAERGPDCAGALVVDDSHLYYSGVDGVSRTTHDWGDREVLTPDHIRGAQTPFVVREGQLFAAVDGDIRRIVDGQDEVLVEDVDPIGLAVGGDTLYWMQTTSNGDFEFFEAALD